MRLLKLRARTIQAVLQDGRHLQAPKHFQVGTVVEGAQDFPARSASASERGRSRRRLATPTSAVRRNDSPRFRRRRRTPWAGRIRCGGRGGDGAGSRARNASSTETSRKERDEGGGLRDEGGGEPRRASESRLSYATKPPRRLRSDDSDDSSDSSEDSLRHVGRYYTPYTPF